jgi:Fic family protein
MKASPDPVWPAPSGELRLVPSPSESFHAFVPCGLTSARTLELQGADALLGDEARGALERLDGISHVIPDANLFIVMYLHKEALLSAQIEGTQSSLSDVLLFEEDGSNVDADAVDVTDYVAALRLGIQALRRLPLSTRMFNEIHARLLLNGRGRERQPGMIRTSQNWIGGTRPGNARFVPPPAVEVAGCLSDLERYCNDAASTELPLVRVARVHAQFETIHPYLDGNGRLGRLLITLCLIAFGIVGEPLLYLSLYLKQHRDVYYEVLQRTRTHGDWEAWIRFFLEGRARYGTSSGRDGRAYRGARSRRSHPYRRSPLVADAPEIARRSAKYAAPVCGSCGAANRHQPPNDHEGLGNLGEPRACVRADRPEARSYLSIYDVSRLAA